MRKLFTIQYLGTRYGGWQLQTNATTIQEVIETALSKTFGSAVRVHGAGRTDAGVHAFAQHAHADVPFEIPSRGLILGLNQLLPHDVRITRVVNVPDDFHARFSATSKTYEYRVWNDEVLDVFAAETHAHVARPLDVDAMREAAQAILGMHDFKAFTVADPEVSGTERTITSITVAPLPAARGEGGRRPGEGPLAQSDNPSPAADAFSLSPHAGRGAKSIRIVVSADGFLRYMVRRIAGSLIEVGTGRQPRDLLLRSLAPTFEPARWTAPAKGLVLRDIRY